MNILDLHPKYLLQKQKGTHSYLFPLVNASVRMAGTDIRAAGLTHSIDCSRSLASADGANAWPRPFACCSCAAQKIA
jgi:hypothetical protein